MDIFINKIEKNKFESLNGLWNNLNLNSPWSVGYVSRLIKNKKFTKKEDWENYYYSSGEIRNNIIKRLKNKHSDIELLNDKETNVIFKNINFKYGRTLEQLNEKGKILYNNATKNKINITLEECIESVRFRVICQTWNGIIAGEKNVIDIIKENFPNIEIIKTDEKIDYDYAVDYELKENNKLLLGIQIKPLSYIKSDSDFIRKAKKGNEIKNKNYLKDFGVNVYNIYYNKSFLIESDIQVINYLNNLIYSKTIKKDEIDEDYWK